MDFLEGWSFLGWILLGWGLGEVFQYYFGKSKDKDDGTDNS